MNILCADGDLFQLVKLRRDVRRIVPRAHITVCRDPCKAEAEAKAKGCDVLLTDTFFDGLDMDGVMLAEQIQRVSPCVNIIFITDHADTSAPYNAWEIGTSAFLLRPYEKQRLARALADPRFASVHNQMNDTAICGTK